MTEGEYREPRPLVHVAHYNIDLPDYMVFEPRTFGNGMEGLEIPSSIGSSHVQLWTNLSLVLYKAALEMEAEVVENRCNLYAPGTQEHFTAFMEYHTLREGWFPPRTDCVISWRFVPEEHVDQINMVCVASKYDGMNSRDEDAWFFGPDNALKKKNGVTLGCRSSDDFQRFMEQFESFENHFLPAIRAASAKVGRVVYALRYV